MRHIHDPPCPLKRDQRSSKVKVQRPSTKLMFGGSISVSESLARTWLSALSDPWSGTRHPVLPPAHCGQHFPVRDLLPTAICAALNPSATLFKAHLIANINISFPIVPSPSLPLSRSLPLCVSAYLAGALIMWAGFNSISHRISCVMSTGNFSSRMACAVCCGFGYGWC